MVVAARRGGGKSEKARPVPVEGGETGPSGRTRWGNGYW